MQPLNQATAYQCDDAREQLCFQHIALVQKWARRLSWHLPNSLQYDDLLSAGVVGLLEAVDRYNASFNIPFPCYAEFRIRGAMLDELRRADAFSREGRREKKALEKAFGELRQRLGREAELEEVASYLQISMDELNDKLNKLKSLTILTFNDSEDIQQATGFDTIAKRLLLERIAQVIGSMSPREQTLLRLYYKEELTMQQAAKIMKVSESRISQLHTQTLLKLKSIMQGIEHDR